jgi:murein DD-endopeptidase MepM/ murein hydrolase activator NlpD
MQDRAKTWRGNAERAALALCAALSLAACAETPRTELSWDVREHKAASNTFYGPRSVTLPPVQQRTLPPVQQKSQQKSQARPYAVAAQKPRKTPGWYTPAPAPQAAPYADNAAAPPQQVAQNTVGQNTTSQNTGSVRFRWPLAGHIVLDYGGNASGERNDGINIAAAPGAEVHAAAAGTVSYCGNELRGYGNLVLIQHDDGYLTAYAHVGSISVVRGDRVAAGQVIATAGASGDVASPQLHFEIRRDKHAIDPKTLLPRGIVVAANSGRAS